MPLADDICRVIDPAARRIVIASAGGVAGAERALAGAAAGAARERPDATLAGNGGAADAGAAGGGEGTTMVMRVDIVTIFPEMVRGVAREGIVARACERGIVDIAVHDLRDFTTDRHRVVDDTPFGGGPGMVLKPEPFFRAVAHIRRDARGARRGDPADARRAGASRTTWRSAWSRAEHIVLLCGRYEGIDERVGEALATEEISIGDYVLSGGELAAHGGGRCGGAAGARGRG